MFIVLLKFSTNKAMAREYMAAHNEWLGQGFDAGVFLLAGSIQPGLGGAIMAHGVSLADLQARVDDDPFVVHGVVSAEILELAPGRTVEQLAFLK